jgi:hypothetical protein
MLYKTQKRKEKTVKAKSEGSGKVIIHPAGYVNYRQYG